MDGCLLLLRHALPDPVGPVAEAEWFAVLVHAGGAAVVLGVPADGVEEVFAVGGVAVAQGLAVEEVVGSVGDLAAGSMQEGGRALLL